MTNAAEGAARVPSRARADRISTALGFAAGLPYALLVGSMGVWLTNAGAGFGAIGALSWIGLFYAFKFIWSPAFDWLVPPFANTIGRRRAWIAMCQVVIALCLFAMTLFDPRVDLLPFASFAVIASFASASQDIVIDAWRIETAQDDRQLDRITVRYQLGYRLAAIIGGALALLLADVWAIDRAEQRTTPKPGVIAGQYGELTLEADGDYAYAVDVRNPAVAALIPESAALVERFVIPTNVGGRSSEATTLGLVIAPPDEGPAISVDRGGLGVFGGTLRPALPGAKSEAGVLSGNAFLDLASGWPAIWTLMAILMAFAVFATLAAPEPVVAPRPSAPKLEDDPELRKLRRRAALPVAAGWAISGAALLGFMFYTLANPDASAAAFRDAATPWILLLTIGAPLCVSYWLALKPGALEAPMQSRAFADILFARVLAPLADLVRRYWLWALPILALAMTYRIADSIWGSFANPFYITILQHSNSDVAVASKMVGVFATLAGIALGGLALLWIGRMPALILGGVVAAGTNLLYADLAHGGAGTQAFLEVSGLGALFTWLLAGFVGSVQATGATIFDGVTLGDGLTRLTSVILMENLAGGFASAVHVAWLSSIVNKNYAAVQYALLSSLALLIGVLFRPRIGAFVDAAKEQGLPAQAERFAEVFVFAAWIGLVAVVLAAFEWWRQRRSARGAPAAP
jgi:VCBS repeat-containing protein